MASKITLKQDIKLKRFLEQAAGSLKEDNINRILNTATTAAVGRIKNGFYTAPEQYWHYFNSNKSRVKLNAGTVANSFYTVRTPEKENEHQIKYKISVLNNAQTGYLGNVAVLLEYGFWNFSGVGVWRKNTKSLKTKIVQDLKNEMKKAQKAFS